MQQALGFCSHKWVQLQATTCGTWVEPFSNLVSQTNCCFLNSSLFAFFDRMGGILCCCYSWLKENQSWILMLLSSSSSYFRFWLWIPLTNCHVYTLGFFCMEWCVCQDKNLTLKLKTQSGRGIWRLQINKLGTMKPHFFFFFFFPFKFLLYFIYSSLLNSTILI